MVKISHIQRKASLRKIILLSFVLAIFNILIQLSPFFQNSSKLDIPKADESVTEDRHSLIVTFPGIHTCDQLAGLEDEQTFQSVDGENHTFVFSAYYDDYTKIGERRIRVIGMTYSRHYVKKPPQMYCYIRFHGVGECLLVNAHIKPIPENQGKRYTASYFICVLPPGQDPVGVSLVSGFHGPLYNRLLVQKSHTDNLNFTICLAPLHSRYYNTFQLIEALEVNRLFGANLMVVYNYSISNETDYLLRKLRKDKMVEMVNFPLPSDVMFANIHPDIHYYGQYTAINDCMYRYAKRTKFIVNTDLDEFIVPINTESWTALTEEVTRRNQTWQIGAFQARTAMFYTFYPDNPMPFPEKHVAMKYRVTTLLKTTQATDLFPYNKRSKIIYDPKRVETVGIHYVWSFISPYKMAYLSPNDSLVHHYRSRSVNKTRAKHGNMHMHKYKDKLVKAISDRWSMLNI